MHGGAAHKSGVVEVGDELREISGQKVEGQDPMQVINRLTSITDDVTLKLAPSRLTSNQSDQPNQVYVRTLFSYSPASDPLIPCPEAGLAFLRGEILRLVNVEDANWWQAVKISFSPTGPLPHSTSFAAQICQHGLGKIGLIPSRNLKECKSQLYPTSGAFVDSSSKNVSQGEHFYEEVEHYIAEDGNYRPIILVVTTREPNVDEIPGNKFLFVTQDEYNTFVEADSLVDQFEPESSDVCSSQPRQLTGICFDALLEIAQAGQVAVFQASFTHLAKIRASSLRPFIVFIKPPSFDVLLETRQVHNRPIGQSDWSPSRSLTSRSPGHKSVETSSPTKSANLSANVAKSSLGFSKNSETCLSESDLQDMIRSASRLEVTHGHLWDLVIINDDLPVALEQLSDLAYRLENQAFWTPKLTFNHTASTTS